MLEHNITNNYSSMRINFCQYMRSRIMLTVIVGVLVAGLFFVNVPYADALEDITLTKISVDKKWSKISVSVKTSDISNAQLSDLSIALAVVNQANADNAFAFVNGESLEESNSRNMEITRIEVDRKGVMKIQAKITGFEKTDLSDLIVAVMITDSNGASTDTFAYAK